MRCLCTLFLILAASASFGEWAMPGREVPIERLLANEAGNLKRNPKDAVAAYHLGRLHSIAYARRAKVAWEASGNAWFGPWMNILLERADPKPPTLEDFKHLRESIRYYRMATQLDPSKDLYRLGLAWMLEQGSKAPEGVGFLPWLGSKALSGSELSSEALRIYRSIYIANIDKDLKAPGHLMEMYNLYLSEDAMRAIMRLDKNVSAEEKTKFDVDLQKLKSKVRGITPIILPLSRSKLLADLVNPSARVDFDLVGDGRQRWWTWVTPNAGILVWDPSKSGKVTSGRQLFGTSTFWLFYSDGYAALASLDDNRDGWLSGGELKGISIWHDRNVNARSDVGEVWTLDSYGIVAVRARATTRRGVFVAADGVKFRDGRTLPTYDWIALPR
jgi:hypothetical protein